MYLIQELSPELKNAISITIRQQQDENLVNNEFISLENLLIIPLSDKPYFPPLYSSTRTSTLRIFNRTSDVKLPQESSTQPQIQPQKLITPLTRSKIHLQSIVNTAPPLPTKKNEN